jgi:hypothetical protein
MYFGVGSPYKEGRKWKADKLREKARGMTSLKMAEVFLGLVIMVVLLMGTKRIKPSTAGLLLVFVGLAALLYFFPLFF